MDIIVSSARIWVAVTVQLKSDTTVLVVHCKLVVTMVVETNEIKGVEKTGGRTKLVDGSVVEVVRSEGSDVVVGDASKDVVVGRESDVEVVNGAVLELVTPVIGNRVDVGAGAAPTSFCPAHTGGPTMV